MPAPVRAERSGRTFFLCLFVAVSIIVLWQLLLGTSPSFSLAVFATFLIVIFTWVRLGLGSIAGVVLGYCTFQFLGLAEIMKIAYGQAADTYLRAPEETADAILVGIGAMCAGALFLSPFMRGSRMLTVEPSVSALAFARNMCFAIAIASALVLRYAGVTAGGEAANGGIAGIARDWGGSSGIGFFCITAEVWRVLTITGGRRSVSPTLIAMIAVLTAIGVLSNTKGGTALPAVDYFIAAWCYRGRLTLPQIGAFAAGVLAFTLIILPVNQVLRADKTEAGVSVDDVEGYLSEIMGDPGKLYSDYAAYQDTTGGSFAYDDSTNYLGEPHEFLTRFMDIAYTDGIVNVVVRDGFYGWSLLSDAAEAALPTFIDPNKPRVGEGDVLTWAYGLRSYGVGGAPQTGLFATTYAMGGLFATGLLCFGLALVTFFEMQLAGTTLRRNLLGTYLFTAQCGFGTADFQSQLGATLRSLPEDICLLIAMFYIADLLLSRPLRA